MGCQLQVTAALVVEATLPLKVDLQEAESHDVASLSRGRALAQGDSLVGTYLGPLSEVLPLAEDGEEVEVLKGSSGLTVLFV